MDYCTILVQGSEYLVKQFPRTSISGYVFPQFILVLAEFFGLYKSNVKYSAIHSFYIYGKFTFEDYFDCGLAPQLWW